MRNRRQASEREGVRDVGTLWTMQRNGMTARCALLARRRAWEVRVVVDGGTLVTERCQRPNDAFQLAECWKSRLLEQRWQQVVPGSGAAPSKAASHGGTSGSSQHVVEAPRTLR